MALNWFECEGCGYFFRSREENPPEHCQGCVPKKLLIAPSAKFMEKVDTEKNKSALVGQQKMLKERARAHSRDVDTRDLIDKNPMEEAIKNRWVREDGRPRKRIDDV